MGCEVAPIRMASILQLSVEARKTGMLVGGFETLAVLGYEMGEISKLMVYAKVARNAGDEESAECYDALMQAALADTLMQLGIIADEYDLDFEELIEDGLARFVQRIRDRGGDA